MFLHIGNNILININEIIGIFDMDNTTMSVDTTNFLKNAYTEEKIKKKTLLPKSYIVIKNKNISKIYFSPMNTTTLLKRINIKGNAKHGHD